MRHRTPRDPGERAANRPAGAPRRPASTTPKTPKTPKTPRPSRRSRPATPPKVRKRRGVRLATGPFRLWSAFCVVAFVLSLFAARLIQLLASTRRTMRPWRRRRAPRPSPWRRPGPHLRPQRRPPGRDRRRRQLIADPTYTSAHATQIATLLHQRLGADYLDTIALLRTPDTRYVQLARHLSPHLANTIVTQLDHENLPGVYTEHDTLRVYPAGDVAAPILGFVGSEGMGLDGLESSLNSTLRGTNGHATYQVVNGQILPLASSTVKEPVEGTGVRLTLDEDLQFLAQRDLAAAVKGSHADSGAAVVMDPRTSQVLALADYPTFNPNDYQADEADWNPRSLDAAYEPGSVEKLLTFSALINSGYVTPTTKIVVPPDLIVDGAQINDYFAHGTLHLTAAGVIALSSNLGMVRAASKMPNGQLYHYLKSFGIGNQLDVGLTGTATGTLAPPGTWPEIQRDNIDFGQGMSVNALQMATAVSAIANGGEYVAPSLIEGDVSSDGHFTPAPPPARHRVISPKAAHDVARMMETVVGPNGTAPLAAIPGYQVAGKTGTAQIASPNGGYGSSVTVSLAGLAPANNPRFVIYVVIQNPREAGAGGGATAGPVFHDLMVSALQKYGVPPTPGKPQPLLPVSW